MSNDSHVNEGLSPVMGGPEIAVLGSARLGKDDRWWALAHELGGLLAEAGFVVVTGGYGGLMAAVSRGAHERDGSVIGLPMQHWATITPNTWNADLRWSSDYGTRLNHILHCAAVIALPGGIGTLSELAVAWAASQTEKQAQPLVLLGECWPPLIAAMRTHLVIGDSDLDLLRFAATPQEAVREVQAGLREQKQGQGPRG
jgi:uncharacterized protein (TIGR00730 family)